MFFAPPKVKSLSRYAEYGAYLGNRHFLLMLGMAITAHLVVIAIYSMVPREEVIRIPVHAINIRLAGGSAGTSISPTPVVPAPAAPADEPIPVKTEAITSVRESAPEAAVEKQLEHEQKPAHHPQNHPVPPGVGKTIRTAQKNPHSHGPEFTFSTPKKYVRETEGDSAKPAAHADAKAGSGGNGSAVAGDAGGQEAISRYTQTISQWIKNHQDVAKSICNQMKASSGQCNVSGQAVVRLRINREGHITYNVIDRTSGNELVDEVVMAMVRASDPVPSVPSDYPSDNQLEFLIAVQPNLSEH